MGKVIHRTTTCGQTDRHYHEHVHAVDTPQSNSAFDDSVVRATPLFDKMLLKVVDTVDPGAVQHAPDSVDDQISGLLCSHNHGGMKAGTC